MKVSKASMVRLRHLAGFSRGRWAALKQPAGDGRRTPIGFLNPDVGGSKVLYSGDVYANESPN
jgi:hypothetical protein